MTRDQFIYGLTACGCLLKDGKTWYEHNELIKCFEDLGLFEQEPTTKIEESNFSQEQYLADIQSAYDCGKSVIDKIRAEIEQSRYGLVNDGLDIALNIIDKYKAESEE